MLWHESCCACDNDYAAPCILTSHPAQGNLADIDGTDEVHVEDTLRRLLELAMLVKLVVEVVARLGYPAIDDHDVDLRIPAKRKE